MKRCVVFSAAAEASWPGFTFAELALFCDRPRTPPCLFVRMKFWSLLGARVVVRSSSESRSATVACFGGERVSRMSQSNERVK